MSYTALYRVWRPSRFSEVIGQNHISQTLKNAILQNRVSHAYLFTGPRGTGKTSLAKIMGKAVNCLELEDGEPCNKCVNCIGINEGSFMDYFEIDAASNRGIDEIREMREKVKFAPSQGKIKVYVIDEVHMLTNEAFNALLKTLEEPPEHVMFILATTEPQKIPLTILSRCQRYDFKKIHEKGIKERLLEIIGKEEISVEDAALDLIIRKAEGGMRDAISILDQGISVSGNSAITLSEIEIVLGTLNSKQLYSLFLHTLSGNIGETLATLDNYLSEGKDIKQIIKDMVDYLRQIILYKASGDHGLIDVSSAEENDVIELSAMKTLPEFNQMLQELIESEQKMYFFSRPKIILESLLITYAEGMTLRQQTEQKKPSEDPQKAKNVQQIEKRRDTENIETKFTDAGEDSFEKIKPESQKIDITTEDADNLWKQVLSQVKKEKIVLHACLIEGDFCLEDGVGKIIFQETKKFHQERAGLQENITLLEKIFFQQTNQEIKFISVLNDHLQIKKEKSSGKKKETIVKEKTEDQGADIIDEALKIFNAELVEIKD